MTAPKIKITLKELIAAAEKNGYKWGGNLDSKTGLPRSHRGIKPFSDPVYCVLEQAAVNLGARHDRWAAISDALDKLGYDLRNEYGESAGRGERIVTYNDNTAKSYKDAVGYMKRVLKKYPNTTVIEF